MRFLIYTRDETLGRIAKTLLTHLQRECGLDAVIELSPTYSRGADLTVADITLEGDLAPSSTCLTTGRGVGELPFPFLRSDFLALVRKKLEERQEEPIPHHGIRFPDGSVEVLSDTEWALLRCLFHRESVSAGEIVSLVWQDTVKEQGLPVYIHHLRKKLEKDGKRRLYSLRGRGYALRAQDIEIEEEDVCLP